MEVLVDILGVKIHNLTMNELYQKINLFLFANEKRIIGYVNLQGLNLAFEDKKFKNIINDFSVLFCDGVGVSLLAKIKYGSGINRYTPPDFIDKICNLAEENNKKIFFLGGNQKVSQKSGSIMKNRFPKLEINSHHGYFNKDQSSLENQEIIRLVNSFSPDLLFVGFGMPLQEKWINENLQLLNCKIVFPVGGMFNYISGEIIRGPKWMTDNGFEWLTRLLIEPKRLWKRYIVGIPKIFWRFIIFDYLLTIKRK